MPQENWHLLIISILAGFGGLWGLIAVGIFAEKDLLEGFSNHAGKGLFLT
jgi:ammonia channel protein AmtB